MLKSSPKYSLPGLRLGIAAFAAFVVYDKTLGATDDHHHH